MKRFRTFLTVALCMAPTAHLSASLKYPAEIGAQIGYLLIEGDSNVKSAPVYGARFATYLDFDTAAELSVLAGKADIRGSDKNSDLLLPTVELQHFFGEGQWRPYIAGGAGYLQNNRDRSFDNNKIDFAVLYGAGVKYQFHPSFLVRLDGRHVIDTVSGKGTHNALVTLGLSWIYGNEDKKAKAVPVAAVVTDADGDGIPDDRDRCPDTPPGTRVNNAGCPLDSDNDGVPDGNDECPDTPLGMQVDAKGCPIPVKAETPSETAVPEKEWVLSGVGFESNSDKLTSSSAESLEKAAGILQAHPNVRVEIQGNTDRTGPAEVNMKLSEARALAVKNYLVSHGISADRLETRGLGFTNPIASNKTADGRAKNRRIEFRVLSR